MPLPHARRFRHRRAVERLDTSRLFPWRISRVLASTSKWRTRDPLRPPPDVYAGVTSAPPPRYQALPHPAVVTTGARKIASVGFR